LDTAFPDAKRLFLLPLSPPPTFCPTDLFNEEQAFLSGADSFDTLSETTEHLVLS